MSQFVQRISCGYHENISEMNLFGENLISWTPIVCIDLAVHTAVLCFTELQRRWWEGTHLRKWQQQFSVLLLPGTLLYTVLLKGNDACICSVNTQLEQGCLCWLFHSWNDYSLPAPCWRICPPSDKPCVKFSWWTRVSFQDRMMILVRFQCSMACLVCWISRKAMGLQHWL